MIRVKADASVKINSVKSDKKAMEQGIKMLQNAGCGWYMFGDAVPGGYMLIGMKRDITSL